MSQTKKPLRFFWRLTTAFFKTHRKTIILGAAISVIFAVSSPFVAQLIGSRPKNIRIGLIGKYTVDTLPREVLSKISQGLTQTNPDGSFSPLIAKGWDISQDGKTYTFILQNNYRWHDDTFLFSDNLAYNFTDVSVKRPNPSTIIFNLKEPFAPFPGILSWPVFKKGLIGVGENQVVSIDRNGKIIEELVLVCDRTNQKTTYRFYPTLKAARTAFKLGEIDRLEEITNPGELEFWPNVRIETKPDQSKLILIIFNTQNDLLAEKSFRQALAYATQKETYERAYGPISPASWAYNPSLKAYDYSPARANEILNELFPEEENKPELTLSAFSDLYPIAEQIASDWEEAGIKTKIETVDFVPDSFQALLLIEELPPDPDQYLIWHSTQPKNLSRLKSPQIDKLLEDGRQTIEFEDRKDIYFDFQRFLVEEAPALFLYHPQVHTLSRE